MESRFRLTLNTVATVAITPLADLCGKAAVAGSCQVAPLGRNLTYGGHHAAGVAVFLPRNRSSLMSNIQSRLGWAAARSRSVSSFPGTPRVLGNVVFRMC